MEDKKCEYVRAVKVYKGEWKSRFQFLDYPKVTLDLDPRLLEEGYLPGARYLFAVILVGLLRKST